jgi:hypothetical protein
VPDDPVPEILALLGLASGGAAASPPDLFDAPTLSEDGPLARSGLFSLWLSSNNTATWIELRGVNPVFRATRTKARLLCALEAVIDDWARLVSPSDTADVAGCTFRTIYGSPPRLEIRHADWRPMRLCRRQAQALIAFRGTVRDFARPR